ncbi:MAG: ATP-dependent sacrificial sulfur transferase LarE [Bacteroidales bacterium]|nr:ATP-dependent sacrificial sulfur transferase LarE [Bacteroidales bacterium]
MINPEKYDMLLQWLGRMENAAIAFSGGVDSTFLLATAQKILGKKVIAFTVKTPYIPDWEVEEAIAFCRERSINHRIIQAGILPAIANNPENRCYLCKKHIFAVLKEEAQKDGYTSLLDGTNYDDTGIYRPGLAALKELGISSPLLENGITKAEVRHFSAELGLPTADKPSYACLLTRLPYEYTVKNDELRRIEKAERFLASIGFAASRVRNHSNIARIEIEKERLTELLQPETAARVVSKLHKLGYEFVTIDMEGFRSGSFDRNKKQAPT